MATRLYLIAVRGVDYGMAVALWCGEDTGLGLSEVGKVRAWLPGAGFMCAQWSRALALQV